MCIEIILLAANINLKRKRLEKNQAKKKKIIRGDYKKNKKKAGHPKEKI
jgi:hypothetical protein